MNAVRISKVIAAPIAVIWMMIGCSQSTPTIDGAGNNGGSAPTVASSAPGQSARAADASVQIPAPLDYVAFSLKQAETVLRRDPNDSGPVRNLAGITRLAGLVYDRS